METSTQIRKKLATLIGQLINRCISEARMVPTVLRRDEVINILVRDPERFMELVREEEAGKTELSRVDLTVKHDAAAELGNLNHAGMSERSVWDVPEADLASFLEDSNRWTRTFSVYFGNAITLFDKEFAEFMTRFRVSLKKNGVSLRKVDFTPEDMAIFERAATAYFDTEEFLYALTFERLLSSQIMMRQIVNLPKEVSLRETIVRRMVLDPGLAPAATRFILRISHVSQDAWGDMVPLLVRLAGEESGEKGLEALVDVAEQDVIFACNLMEQTYEKIRRLSPEERRRAIRERLESM